MLTGVSDVDAKNDDGPHFRSDWNVQYHDRIRRNR